MSFAESLLELFDLDVQPQPSSFPLLTDRPRMQTLMLNTKRKQYTLLKEVMKRIFGHSSDTFQSFLFTVRKAPYAVLLRELFTLLHTHADNLPLLRTYLLANAIPSTGTLTCSEHTHKLLDLILDDSTPPDLLRRKLGKWNTSKSNRLFELLQLVRLESKRKPFEFPDRLPHDLSEADLQAHRLQTPKKEYQSLLRTEGAVYRNFWQALFLQLRSKGVAVFKRTKKSYLTSDFINRRLNNVGGLLRELCFTYYPLNKRRGEKRVRVVHKGKAELDFADGIRPLFHYLVYLTKNERSDGRVSRLARQLFYRLMPFLNSLYTGDAAANLVDVSTLNPIPSSTFLSASSSRPTKHLRNAEDLASLVHQVAAEVPSVKINIPPPQFVNHDPASVLQRTSEDKERLKIGTQLHDRLLNPFPTVHSLRYPIASFKHQQDTTLLIASEVPISTPTASGKIDLLVLLRHPVATRWKPVLLLEVKSRSRLILREGKPKPLKYQPQAWLQQLHRYPRASDRQQLDTYTSMLAEACDLTSQDRQDLRSGVLVVDGAERSSLHRIRNALVSMLKAELATPQHRDEGVWQQLAGKNAHLYLRPGSFPACSWTEGEPDNLNVIRTLEDAEDQDFHPLQQATDIYCDSHSYRTGALAATWQTRLLLLDSLLATQPCMIVTPTLALRDRLSISDAYLWTSEPTPSLLEAYLHSKPESPTIIFFDYEHLPSFPEFLADPQLQSCSIIRFRDLRSAPTYSLHFDSRCQLPQYDDDPQKRIFVLPAPPDDEGLHHSSATRLIVVEEREKAPFTASIELPTLRSDHSTPDLDPEIALDLLADHSLHLFAPAEDTYRSMTLPPATTTTEHRLNLPEPQNRIHGSTEVNDQLSTTYPTPRKSLPEAIDHAQVLHKEQIRLREVQRSYDLSYPELSQMHLLTTDPQFQAFDQVRRATLAHLFEQLERTEELLLYEEWLGLNYFPFLQSIDFDHESPQAYQQAFKVLETDLQDQLGVPLQYSYVRNFTSLHRQIEQVQATEPQEPQRLGIPSLLAFAQLPAPPLDEFDFHRDHYAYWYLSLSAVIYQADASFSPLSPTGYLRPARRYLQALIASYLTSKPSLHFLPLLQQANDRFLLETDEHWVQVRRFDSTLRFSETDDFAKITLTNPQAIQQKLQAEFHDLLSKLDHLLVEEVTVNVRLDHPLFHLQLTIDRDEQQTITLPSSRQTVHMLRNAEYMRDQTIYYWKRANIFYEGITRALQVYVDDLQRPLHIVPDELDELSPTSQLLTHLTGNKFSLEVRLMHPGEALKTEHTGVPADLMSWLYSDDLFVEPYYIVEEATAFHPELGTPAGRIFQVGENHEHFRKLLPFGIPQLPDSPEYVADLHADLENGSVWLEYQEIPTKGRISTTETEYLVRNNSLEAIADYLSSRLVNNRVELGYAFTEDTNDRLVQKIQELLEEIEELREKVEDRYDLESCSLEMDEEEVWYYGDEVTSYKVILKYKLEPREAGLQTIYGSYALAEHFRAEGVVTASDVSWWMLSMVQDGLDAPANLLNDVMSRFEDLTIIGVEAEAENLYSEAFVILLAVAEQLSLEEQKEIIKELITFSVDTYANDYLYTAEPDDRFHLFSVEQVIDLAEDLLGAKWYEHFVEETWKDSNKVEVDVFTLYDLMGSSYLFEEDTQKAEESFKQGLHFREQYGLTANLIFSYVYLRELYYQTEEFEDAEVYCWKTVHAEASAFDKNLAYHTLSLLYEKERKLVISHELNILAVRQTMMIKNYRTRKDAFRIGQLQFNDLSAQSGSRIFWSTPGLGAEDQT